MAYLPLLFSFGVVDVALEFVFGVLDVDGVELPEGGVDDEAFDSDDELDDGGVAGAVDDDGDVVAALVPVELVLGVDDIEPLVDGGVVVDDDEDVDGDGVTVGGVVPGVEVFDASRLQPAIPRTRPLARTVTNTVFIAISKELIKGCPPADLADSMPLKGI